MAKEEQPVKVIRFAAILTVRFINLDNGHNGHNFGSLASKQKQFTCIRPCTMYLVHMEHLHKMTI